jgi:hypothetical protein
MWVCGEQNGTGQVFLPVLLFVPRQYNTTNAPHSSSSIRCSYQQDTGAKPGNRPKGNSLLEIWEHWIEKYFQSLLSKHAVSQRVLLAFDCRSPGCRKVALGQALFWQLGVLACHYHSTNAVYSSACTYWSYQKDKWTRPGNHPKSNAVSGIGNYQINNYSLFLISLKY